MGKVPIISSIARHRNTQVVRIRYIVSGMGHNYDNKFDRKTQEHTICDNMIRVTLNSDRGATHQCLQLIMLAYRVQRPTGYSGMGQQSDHKFDRETQDHTICENLRFSS